MRVAVDFEECLKDSPRFRAALEDVEGDVTELELKLDKLVKLCIVMIDTGKAFCVANKQFIHGLRDLAHYSSRDDLVEGSLSKFSDSLQEMINYHTQKPLPKTSRCKVVAGGCCVEGASLGLSFFPFQILFDQTQRSIKAQLQMFVKEDIRKFKDAKKQFEKVSEEKENALAKNAQAPRNKQHEVEEATNILTATRKCFRHIALDYVLQINVLQSKRRSEILKSMLSFMCAHLAFFHQGYDLFSELGPYMKDLGAQLDRLALDAAREKKEMEQKHSTIQQKGFSSDDLKLEYNVDAVNGIVMEGYLFKRASNAFKTWNRRWFSIQNNQLVYQKKFRDAPTVVVEDLRLCSVKPCEDLERRFCFEVVSPTKSCILQADSEKLRQAWIQAVQTSIASAYREKGEKAEVERKRPPSTGSPESSQESKEKSLKGEGSLQRVQAIAGNEMCCDCGLADPRWASINLGITLCIECSGIHRSLGVHFSKVRSLTLDSWEPELLKLMCELGNNVINRVYEANREKMGAKKPHSGSQRQEKEEYIRAKYVDRRFVSPADPGGKPALTPNQEAKKQGSPESTAAPLKVPGSPQASQADGEESKERLAAVAPASVLHEPEGESQGEASSSSSAGAASQDAKLWVAGLQLYQAAYQKSLPHMAEALAQGAEVNWRNQENGFTPLIQAVRGGSLVTCEFLLQNGANVNLRDAQGRGPLHHATILGHTGQVCLFLKRGANQHARDEDGKDPLSVAIEAANADIVTLLRLARMNEEMRESEGLYGQPGDETYQDIFRDFSQMASNNPEKLKRFQPPDTPEP
ncbi:arf-GAP with coiled-coil, ANK repeat and PH domain-containing protein 2 isoform X2 [Crotalus tigris]|uniref:arf-GAP with coiled-coil, ANK repeat and PH domain-containing protein 2 isoform X2 n=1 Tax=Crotalus tigris TaxID=88082 RepID=UPI00192F558A|nr:arf-GAP with coiled-coil, ANK repeat and PH domain-containing protein 2 isoform X2 [Crotalus tigris]